MGHFLTLDEKVAKRQVFFWKSQNVGRRGGFEEGRQWCILRGRRNVFAFWMKMLEVQDVKFVEGVRFLTCRNHLLVIFCRHHFS